MSIFHKIIYVKYANHAIPPYQLLLYTMTHVDLVNFKQNGTYTYGILAINGQCNLQSMHDQVVSNN
jgi:hypothetical protein